MKVRPLAGRATAIRDALLSHGWEGDLASLTAGGIECGAFHVTGIDGDVAEAMLSVAGRLGLELVTGDGWLILAGARSRLGAFARPWLQPEPVRDVATAIGMALPLDHEMTWRHALGTMVIDRAVIVGIVNVTPDSFSDGGQLPTPDAALEHATRLVKDGAIVLDVGGESTRPGASPLSPADEQARVLPVIGLLRRALPDTPVSVDTLHAATAAAALDAGAAIINDVTAGRHDPALFDVVARYGAGLVLSHSRGPLGQLASYDFTEYHHDVTGEVLAELDAAMAVAGSAGVAAEAMVIDPGFGFGKTTAQSLTLLRHLDAFALLGRPVMAGVSRKRFLGDATGQPPADRDRATAAACALAFERGARLFRVHDPGAVRDALRLATAVMEPPH